MKAVCQVADDIKERLWDKLHYLYPSVRFAFGSFGQAEGRAR